MAVSFALNNALTKNWGLKKNWHFLRSISSTVPVSHGLKQQNKQEKCGMKQQKTTGHFPPPIQCQQNTNCRQSIQR
jgi:hypothetical protein